MKLRSTLVGLCLALATPGLQAQEARILVKPAESKTWGFVNLKGEMAIAAEYRKVSEFTADGFAAVYDGEYYFINAKGEKLETEAQNFKLKNFLGFGMRGFNNGVAPVEVNKKWGYINTSGKIIIAPKYDYVTAFNDDIATAKVGKQWYIINKQGAETAVNIPNLKNLRDFVNGYAIFDNMDKKFGYINAKGEVVIEPTFTSVGDFYNGMAWAKNDQKMSGYINTKGEWVIEPTYNVARNFDAGSGMAMVKQTDQWFYITKDGQAVKPGYDKIDDFKNGIAMARKGELTGFIDKTGKWLITPQYEGARDFENGYAAAKSNGKWGIINTKGEWVIQPKHDAIKDVIIIK